MILKWLQVTYNCEVVTFTADLGQGEELEPARAKAVMMGVKPEHIYIDDLKEEFMAKQRQVSLACLPGNEPVKGNIADVIDDMKEYCPKIKRLLDVIETSPGKHVVYSNFVQSGLRVVERALEKAGWIALSNVSGDESLWQQHKGKVFALWDGSVKDAEKQMIKSVANAKDNLFGDRIRVILGSPSVKEGVSFKHIQHIHLLDPVWNQSAKTQVEGRAIRYCSHVEIDETIHKPLRRTVIVNVFKSVPRPKGGVQETCDQIIYDTIIENKEKLIKSGERALKKVAIDHYLFRNMYKNKTLKTPTSPLKSAPSPIELHARDDVLLVHNKKKRKTNSCPKKRRPSEEGGICPPDMEKRKNKQGDECCYKMKKKKITKLPTKPPACPKPRRPVNGECKDGYTLKSNKQGEPCCYKTKKANK